MQKLLRYAETCELDTIDMMNSDLIVGFGAVGH